MIKSKKPCPLHPNMKRWANGVCIKCHRKKYGLPAKEFATEPITEKEKNELAVHRMKHNRYLRQHPFCEIKLMGCSLQSYEINHKAAENKDNTWSNEEYFIAGCKSCTDKIKNSPALARNLKIYNYSVI